MKVVSPGQSRGGGGGQQKHLQESLRSGSQDLSLGAPRFAFSLPSLLLSDSVSFGATVLFFFFTAV